MGNAAKILITGDTHLGGGRVNGFALKNQTEALFGEFIPLIRGVDLAITNLESPLIDEGSPIPKTGPNLKSPVNALPVLRDAGFNLVTLANNHIMDYGGEGLVSTMEACTKAGIEIVGAGKNIEEAKRPFIREICGIRISVINIAENEFGTTQNGTPGGHPLDPVQNFYAIKKAKEKSDRVIVIVHGGHEHYELPSPRMVETYRFFADAGADAIAGHHTHCFSGYEVYNNVPIFYSLGNYLFDKPFNGFVSPWHSGMMVELIISKSGLVFKLHPFIQNADRVGLRVPDKEEGEKFNAKLIELNQIIHDDEKLAEEFDSYCRRSRRLYSSYVEPHSVWLLHALRNRNLLPSMLSKSQKRLLLNLTRCEAHRDVLIKTLSL